MTDIEQKALDLINTVLVEKYQAGMYLKDTALSRFIIAKPDPLEDVLDEMCIAPHYAKSIHAALEARGLEIREKNDGV